MCPYASRQNAFPGGNSRVQRRSCWSNQKEHSCGWREFRLKKWNLSWNKTQQEVITPQYVLTRWVLSSMMRNMYSDEDNRLVFQRGHSQAPQTSAQNSNCLCFCKTGNTHNHKLRQGGKKSYYLTVQSCLLPFTLLHFKIWLSSAVFSRRDTILMQKHLSSFPKRNTHLVLPEQENGSCGSIWWQRCTQTQGVTGAAKGDREERRNVNVKRLRETILLLLFFTFKHCAIVCWGGPGVCLELFCFCFLPRGRLQTMRADPEIPYWGPSIKIILELLQTETSGFPFSTFCS